MKKKKLFSTAATALAAISMLSVLPMNAWAADYSETLVTEADLKTTSFDKYLVMDVNANVPNATFTYTIVPGSAITADTENGTLAVLAGVGEPKLQGAGADDNIGKAVFTSSDVPIAESSVAQGDTPVFSTTGEGKTSDEKYAKKTVSIDFSNVQFTEPGVYRYVITESGTNQGVTNDAISTRTLDVYVEDATASSEGITTKQLKITGYVMYSGTIETAPKATSNEDAESPNNGAEAGTKSDSYTNTYSTHDLTFSKTVTGNQGSKDKYFKFTVNISGAVAGTKYTVDIANADAAVPETGSLNAATDTNYAGKSNTNSIVVPDNETSVSADFYLQHGQSIVIKGLADGTAYTITEAQEDYAPTAAITGDTVGTTNSNSSVSDTGLNSDTTVAFTNNRNGVIPTGVLVSVAPIAIIGIAVIGGIVFLMIKNKRREAEED